MTNHYPIGKDKKWKKIVSVILGKAQQIFEMETWHLESLTTRLDDLKENCSISTIDYGVKEIVSRMNKVRIEHRILHFYDLSILQ